jgi:subtilisin family serine protease
MPQASVSADNLYFQSGAAGQRAVRQAAAPASSPRSSLAVGIIDGAPSPAIPVTAMRGFADGAGTASDHGSAIVSLLRGNGVTNILVADVYGTDRAGANALAIARALSWLSGQGVRVVAISLTGPNNPVVARAVAAVRTRGLVVVAAVGNDGPAAPPAYPASYDDVVAVTAVDGRERALIEAGRALHLDYAAPGADIRALNRRGRSGQVRGTSYAVPLVASRVASALQQGPHWRSALDNEAADLGERGADPVYGRGLVCRGCAGER